MAETTDYEARRSAFGRKSFAERQQTHDEIAAAKREAMAARVELGRTYLAQHGNGITVPHDRAVAVVELVEETRAARDEAVALLDGRTAGIDNGALQFPVLGHEFAADGPVIGLATQPLLLAPVVRYFGMMPILFNAFVTRAHQEELKENSPHRFHLDPEDTISFKLFVHLTDVDEDCGPFHALPADRTQTVLDAVDYRGVTMLDDAAVADLVGWDAVVAVTGPAGTVALADTTRCLHFGGRPRAAGKPVREMVVIQYLLPTSVILVGEHADSPRRFMSQLEPTGDDAWDALLGATHT
ncbi:MAG TPA: hypothetical protein VM262_19300 [Acidimicrobiales bacterium]|nr:hypothetical protein [Acidimicrobiales bacterium]